MGVFGSVEELKKAVSQSRDEKRGSVVNATYPLLLSAQPVDAIIPLLPPQFPVFVVAAVIHLFEMILKKGIYRYFTDSTSG